ncbi:LLM class flavin-dependent oxidoreductase [Mycolicibacterium goodii]|uniref:LLM class flavin-dependent oxidoreductase n=1 Tax=Mycolicibacterium goodii TaxID=134601 RepID=A0ABS6HKW1_MYCGD|nr:LLM class flavin-dependent oxidoreductase [Mycolicibacterium goodii]OKH68921.1 5,10-methylene tetrahydromethanopterin reductase [Mycobacterium sp. SWH-M5]MBU8812066.1 LLM class flavin-dependent oxidoreductase [Mycolicibacterium goodii]MBU8816367.1 LLM class flavin-dependent oxidoreductase [Mycolicibacterium goodii]MBU8822956.1 LLM class flavin-dependent oxidoreductase [Mycolicibacterium goodii]MBU8830641.1 LLM class flavin-dependent oxidoreductase [Mycolicibacterium goodii]
MTRIYLNAFDMACVGHQSAGLWRHPDDQGHRYRELGYWTDLARTLEAGGFDALFLADILGVYDIYGGSRDAAVADAAQFPVNDPTLAVSAMAAVTESLGFGVTVSLTYEQPYALARRFATLDHLTEGRVAWNIVTSYLDSAARNLGLDAQIPHDERYEIAEEYLEVCYKLWEASWEPDAVVRDAERGVFTDPAKVHDIEHKGRYFSVPGPFLCEPSPQRTPVLFQAGASPRGVRFAAGHAEAVFVSGPTPEIVAKPVKALRDAAAEQGRDPRAIKVFTMVTPIVAETHDEAVAKLDEYRKYVSPEGALALFGGWTGVDLAELGPDEPLRYVQTEANRSALASFTTAERPWTARELAHEIGLGGRGPLLVGSPSEVADELERWVDEADVDGFNLAYVTTPGTFVDFARHVVPELRRRGRVPAAGERVTLRERLGGAGPLLAADHPGAAYRPAGWY